MKKFMFIAALACFALTANAQELTKEQKEAQKEAMKVVKKAQSTYEEGMPNQQYGRKEVNYDKINEAKALIDQAVTNPYCQQDKQTYKTAAEINYQIYTNIDNKIKAGETGLEAQQLEVAENLVNYCVKYDSLYSIDPKKKDAEYKTDHTRYQIIAFNPLVPCVNAAQSLSGSDDEAEAKKAYRLSNLVQNSLQSSSLFKDFTHPAKEQMIMYSKAFKAQALSHIKSSNPSEVESAYLNLRGTQFETTAYNALINYYQDKDSLKYIEYIKLAYEHSDSTSYPGFADRLLVYYYKSHQDANLAALVADIKTNSKASEAIIAKAYTVEGQNCFDKKDYAKAEQIFAEATAKYPDNEDLAKMPSICAWQKSAVSGKKTDQQHALDLFKQLESKYPNNPEKWGYFLYVLYNNTGNTAMSAKYKKYQNMK